FVLNSHRETRATGGIDAEPFRLSRATINQPSHFEIAFIAENRRYRYGFEVTQERVTAEWLYFVPSTREARLFEREGDNIVLGSYFKEGRDLEQHTRPNAIFLSVVAQFNGPTAQRLVEWFRKKTGIISGLTDAGILPYTWKQLLEGEYRESIKELICRLDLGIADLQATTSGQIPQFSEGMPEEMRQALLTLFTESERLSIRTIHTRYDMEGKQHGEELFDLHEHESGGTQKLVAISGPLIDTLTKGRVLVVDELDARL